MCAQKYKLKEMGQLLLFRFFFRPFSGLVFDSIWNLVVSSGIGSAVSNNNK